MTQPRILVARAVFPETLERLARHFEAFDESYGDALAMSDASGNTIAIRLTARGKAAGGAAYSKEKILLLELEEGLITRFALFSTAGS